MGVVSFGDYICVNCRANASNNSLTDSCTNILIDCVDSLVVDEIDCTVSAAVRFLNSGLECILFFGFGFSTESEQ